MKGFLTVFLGQYTMFFYVYCKEFITLLVYSLILVFHKRKKKHYFLRLSGCFLIALIFCIPFAILRTEFPNISVKILNNSLIYLFLFGLLFLCYDESFSELCFCWTGIVASKGLAGNLFALTLNAFGKDDLTTISFFETPNQPRDWLICWLFDLVCLTIIFFLLRRQKSLKDDFANARNSVILMSTTYILACPLYSVVHTVQSADFTLAVCCKLLFVILYLFILIIRAGLFFNGKVSQELEFTEQLLHQEKRHYEDIKENLDIINMKCHDIKRQMNSLQNKLTEEELRSLHAALEIYDSNVKTGNDILDVILYQKQLFCTNNGIRMSCMADGTGISFLSNSDMYALFSNALENTIEAVRPLTDEDKRVISLTVERTEDRAKIEVANYYSGTLTFEKGLPSTSKADKNHHGYGMKSMKYIVEKYHGNLHTETEDDIFFLTVSFPLSNAFQ